MQLDVEGLARKLSRNGRPKKQADGSWQTNCPCSFHRHGDRNPSLNLTEKNGRLMWKCYSGGTQEDVWAAMVARVPELGQDLPPPNGKPAQQAAASAPQKTESRHPPIHVQLSDLPVDALDYLHSRGLSDTTIIGAKLGYDPKLRAIAFPYFRDGKVQHVKYLRWWEEDRKKRWSQTVGGGKCYYGLDDIDTTKPVIITEGEIDRLSAIEAGFQAVSVPNGVALSGNEHPEYIANSEYLFSKIPKLILAGDNDDPGLQLRENLAKIYGKDKCFTVEYPPGCKDNNAVLQDFGPEALADCLNSAQPFPIRALQSASQYTSDVFELYRFGKQRGMTVGYDSVDAYYSVVPGELEIVTGIPSSGKTNWIDQICVNLSERYGVRHAVCSFENPMAQHLSILAEKRARKSFVGYGDTRLTEEELAEALEWIDQHFTFIRFDDDTTPTVDQIITHAKAAKIRFGIKTLVVDPWNYIEQARRSGQSETEYISETLSKLRIFAQNNDVHVWLVAHPPKLQKDKDGELNAPTGYDVAGSAHFYNKADVFTVVHRNPTVSPQEVQLIWRKVRFKMTGQPGQITMKYNLRTGCYEEMY